jgi:hypothetical protein
MFSEVEGEKFVFMGFVLRYNNVGLQFVFTLNNFENGDNNNFW